MPGSGESGVRTEEDGVQEEKPHWMELFERGSHRRYLEYLRDKEYENIINTLRRSFSDEEELGPPVHLPIPPEQYFLTPDFSPNQYGVHGSRSSGSTITSGTVTSSSASTALTSVPTSLAKYLPPEVIEEKKRYRRNRTVTLICVGVLAISLLAMTVGVVLHFLLETGILGTQGRSPPIDLDARGQHSASLRDSN